MQPEPPTAIAAPHQAALQRVAASRCDPEALRRRHVLAISIVYWPLCALCLRFALDSPDAIGYYTPLQSMLVDGDLSVHEEFRRWGMYGWLFELTSLGYVKNVFAIGSSMLWAPFVLVGHGLCLLCEALGAQVRADGQGLAYLGAVALGSAVYGYFGLLLGYRICSWIAGPKPALWATLAIWLFTPLWQYTFFQPNLSHVLSAACVAFALDRFLAWREQARDVSAASAPASWFAIGLSVGLASAVRWESALLGIAFGAPLLCDLVRGRGAGVRALRAPLACLAGGLLALTPQLLVWHMSFGRWLTVPQGESFLHWANPAFAQLLWSTRHGLFAFAPILVPACFGLVLLARSRPALGLMLLFILVSQLYVCAIAGDVAAGISFGARRMVGSSVLFAAGLALVYGRLPVIASCALTSVCGAWSSLMWLAYHGGILDRYRAQPFDQLALSALDAARRVWPLVSHLDHGRFAGLSTPGWLGGLLAALACGIALSAVWLGQRLFGRAAPAETRARRRRLAVWIGAAALSAVNLSVLVATARSAPAPVTALSWHGALMLDFGWYASSRPDYEPFTPRSYLLAHPLHLPKGVLRKAGVPYRMPDPPSAPDASSVVSTCQFEPVHIAWPLQPSPTRALHLVLDGLLLYGRDRPVATLQVDYATGAPTRHELRPGRDVWGYEQRPPRGRILWEQFDVLSTFTLPLDPARVPVRLAMTTRANAPLGFCISVFAISQELADAEFALVDLAPVANADHTRDPFVRTAVRNPYPELHPGLIEDEGTPFWILDPERSPLRGSTITTASEGRSTRVPLIGQRSRALALLVDGRQASGAPDAGELRIEYASGPSQRIPLRFGDQIRDYSQAGPAGHVAWRGSPPADLTRLDVQLDPKRLPRNLWIDGLPDAKPRASGITVFAITQLPITP